MLRNNVRNSILFDRWLEHGSKTFNENLRCGEPKAGQKGHKRLSHSKIVQVSMGFRDVRQ